MRVGPTRNSDERTWLSIHQLSQRNFADMTIHDPKANTGFPDPVQDDERLADLICPQIHSLISQLHRLGKLRPEQINQQLWDLVDAVKHIAQQYADDYLAHSPSLYSERCMLQSILSKTQGRQPTLPQTATR